MDDAERDVVIRKIAEHFASALSLAKCERMLLSSDDPTAQWLDQTTAELGSLAEEAYDLETFRAIHHAVQLHGDGPWPVDELAAITGRDVASVERILRRLVEAGIGQFHQ
ncbi:hypothetical protein ABZW96_33285 [Nocardia sp. NPDC004168]|uniref:hypothetical protein n=1 Tax=Nocardia sp. NPDC004168 TaxID=3154452 RepID=UPI0033A22B5D